MISDKQLDKYTPDELVELYFKIKKMLNPVSVPEFIKLTGIKECQKTIYNRMTIVKNPKLKIKHDKLFRERAPFANYFIKTRSK